MSVPRQESKWSCFTFFLVYICVFRGIQFSSFYDFWIIQSNLYIKAIQGNLKMWPFWEAALYMQVKLYALFINGEMRLPFIDSDLYIEVPFEAGLTTFFKLFRHCGIFVFHCIPSYETLRALLVILWLNRTWNK